MMHLLHGMLGGARVALWLLLDLVVLAVAIGVASDIRASLARRRRRIASERATWAESVTKQTKPPPISQRDPFEPFVRPCGCPGGIVPHIGSICKMPAPAPVAQDSTLPSPTAPASARKVRAATKRRR